MVKHDSSSNPRRHRAAPNSTPPDRRATTARTVGVVVPPAPPSQRGTLSRQKVLTAAIDVIDSDGAREFTMRRVADRFGVEAMALYNYFPSRELLLDGVVERVVDDLYNDPRVDLNTDNWQEFLSRVAHGVRRTALAHPLLFPLIATRGPPRPGCGRRCGACGGWKGSWKPFTAAGSAARRRSRPTANSPASCSDTYYWKSFPTAPTTRHPTRF